MIGMPKSILEHSKKEKIHERCPKIDFDVKNLIWMFNTSTTRTKMIPLKKYNPFRNVKSGLSQ